jgi:hypothetical protein
MGQPFPGPWVRMRPRATAGSASGHGPIHRAPRARAIEEVTEGAEVREPLLRRPVATLLAHRAIAAFASGGGGLPSNGGAATDARVSPRCDGLGQATRRGRQWSWATEARFRGDRDRHSTRPGRDGRSGSLRDPRRGHPRQSAWLV